MAFKWNRNYETITCKTCGKEVERPVFRHAKFCNRKCAAQQPNSGRFQKGHKPWITGKKLGDLRKTNLKIIGQKISKAKLGKSNPVARYNPQVFKKGRKIPKEQLKKILGKQGISSLEIKFEDIIKKLNLPYKFVGNGQVMVARKVPDFVNSEGKKIAIEVYYRKHKEVFRGGLEEWKAERVRVFNREGWQIIFFNETEVKENIVIKKLKGGN